ncbi:MAG: hypothetical protein IJJ13_05820 [Lachnospiraceae bacterium]|nr:hypothetical protein [Lachnospiraceae bacterium]
MNGKEKCREITHPVPAGRDPHIPKDIFLTKHSPEYMVVSAQFLDIHDPAFPVLQKDQHFVLPKHHDIQHFFFEPFFDLRQNVLIGYFSKIKFILCAASFTKLQEPPFVIFLKAVFTEDAAQILPIRRNDSLADKFHAPDRIDAVDAFFDMAGENEGGAPFIHPAEDFRKESFAALIIKQISEEQILLRFVANFKYDQDCTTFPGLFHASLQDVFR